MLCAPIFGPLPSTLKARNVSGPQVGDRTLRSLYVGGGEEVASRNRLWPQLLVKMQYRSISKSCTQFFVEIVAIGSSPIVGGKVTSRGCRRINFTPEKVANLLKSEHGYPHLCSDLAIRKGLSAPTFSVCSKIFCVLYFKKRTGQ